MRQKVLLLTDDEPGQRAFYEGLGYNEVREYADGALRAFVRFDTWSSVADGREEAGERDR